MNNAVIRQLLPVLYTAIILGGIHFFLINYSLPELYASTSYWLIYVFLFPLSVLAVLILSRRYQKNKESVGKNFFAYVIIKMIASLLFLSPWLYYKSELSKPFVYQFFAVFFPLLVIETWVLIRMLNRNDTDQ